MMNPYSYNAIGATAQAPKGRPPALPPAQKPQGRWQSVSAGQVPADVQAALVRATQRPGEHGTGMQTVVAHGAQWMRVTRAGRLVGYYRWVPATPFAGLAGTGGFGLEGCRRCSVEPPMVYYNAIGLRGSPFALGAADPFDGLTAAQQSWVLTALAAWNAASGTCTQVPAGTDLGFPQARVNAVACFQDWYNAGAPLPGGGGFNAAMVKIGVGQSGMLTQDTLSQLVQVMGNAPGFVGVVGPYPAGGAAAPAKSKTVWYVIGGVAVAAVVAGGVVMATRKPRRAAA